MIRFSLICGILTACLFLAACAPTETRLEDADPQDSPLFRLLDEAGGEDAFTYAVNAHDSIVAFGRGPDLIIADIGDPSKPEVLGTVRLRGEIRDVVLRGRTVYAAADSGGFQIIDVSNPRTPTIISGMRFEDRVYGVDADDGHAYVAARSAGLHIVDVSDASALKTVGHVVTPDEAVDVVVRDDFAFVAAWYESMRVIDVSDRSAPEEVSFASFDSYDNGAAWSVYVEEDIGLATVPDMGLRMVDISDPRDVKLHKVYRGLFAPAGVAARGRIAYVADQSAGFRVLDLSDPVAPVEIGSLDLPGRAMAVALEGDAAYVAAREGGLRIVDISRPHDPHEVAYIDSGDEIADVAVFGDTVIAAGLQNGALLYREAARLHADGIIPFPARRVVVQEDRLILAGETGIALYDRADVSRRTAFAELSGSIRGVASGENLVVAATEQFGLRILGPGSGGTLHEIGSFEPERAGGASMDRLQMQRTPVAAWDVLVDGDRAFAAFDDGIRLIDFSRPSRPTLIGLLATPERVFRLTLRGDRLFAACDDGIRAIDVSDPANLSQIGHVKTPSFATSMAWNGDRMYVGDLSGMITVVETDEPVRRIAEGKVAERILGLTVVRNGIAVASGREGVRVVAHEALETGINLDLKPEIMTERVTHAPSAAR